MAVAVVVAVVVVAVVATVAMVAVVVVVAVVAAVVEVVEQARHYLHWPSLTDEAAAVQSEGATRMQMGPRCARKGQQRWERGG